MASQRKGVSILRSGENFQLKCEKVEDPFCHSEREKSLVASCAIIGPSRSGKSSFFNLLAQLLKEQKTGEQKLPGNHVLPDVFHWKGGRNADTVGLSLLNEPFLVERKEFGKTSLFLMDTEGTGNSGKDTSGKQDKLLATALATSSLIIYNVDGHLQANDLENVAMMSLKSRHGSQRPLKFQKLLILIRNFKYFKPDKSADQGKNYLQALCNSQSPEVRKSMEALQALYETVDCAVFPRPVNLRENSEKDTACTKNDFGETFVKETGKLIKKYFSPTTIIPKQISGRTLNGREMFELFKAFQDNVGSVQDLVLDGYSAFRDARMKKLEDDCFQHYKSSVKEEDKCTLKALTFSHEDNLDKALKMFDDKKFNQCSEDYRQNLENRIYEVFLEDQKTTAEKEIEEVVKNWQKKTKQEIKFKSSEVKKSYEEQGKIFCKELKRFITDAADLTRKYELFARKLRDVCNEELQRVKDNKKKAKIAVGAVVGAVAAGPLVLLGPVAGAVGAVAVGAEMAVEGAMAIGGVVLAATGAATATAANATVQAFNTLHLAPHLSELGVNVTTEEENEDVVSGGENVAAGMNAHDDHAYEDSSYSEVDISDEAKPLLKPD